MIFLASKVAADWQDVGRGSTVARRMLRGKSAMLPACRIDLLPISSRPHQVVRRLRRSPRQELVMSIAKHAKRKQVGQQERQTASTADFISALRILSNDVAQIKPDNQWVDLNVSASELRPSATLTSGQCFNWIAVDTSSSSRQQKVKNSAWGVHDAEEWIGPLDKWVLSIRETRTSTFYRVVAGPNDEPTLTEYLRNYFQLETPLEPLYEKWSMQDPKRMKRIAAALPGVRVLRQDPIECLFSFICSSNNNIPRINLILSRLRNAYGEQLIEMPVISNDAKYKTISVHAFPTLEALQAVTESDLRNLGLGYRARYLIQTRDLLVKSGGKEYLLDLRGKDADFIQKQLVKFQGVGPKVADCVALFSLDASAAIPVDVHVQQIACRDYGSSALMASKSLTPTIYKQVGDTFRTRFESHAGWAHSLLFAAELPSFRPVLPLDLIEEMDEWREQEKKRKEEKKESSKKKKALQP